MLDWIPYLFVVAVFLEVMYKYFYCKIKRECNDRS
jgi:hypothetical protein